MENQPTNPEFQPFDDLVNVDAYGRGHRPDGKFLSGHELGQIGAHQELIRSLDPSAYEGRHRATEATENFAATEAIPVLAANETNPSRLTAAKAFFGRRAAQLSGTFNRTRYALDRWYGESPDEWNGDNIPQGLRLTAAQTVRAHMHPYQLGRNASSNIARLRGRWHDSAYDRSPAHPVVRRKLYNEAARGNPDAIQYLWQHDGRLGETDYGYGDAASEHLRLLSGMAAARKIGLIGLMGVSLGGALMAKGPEKQKYVQRFQKLAAHNAVEFSTRRYDKRQQKYAAVRAEVQAYAAHQPPSPPVYRRDPFSSF